MIGPYTYSNKSLTIIWMLLIKLQPNFFSCFLSLIAIIFYLKSCHKNIETNFTLIFCNHLINQNLIFYWHLVFLKIKCLLMLFKTVPFCMRNHYVWDVVFSDGFCWRVERSTLLLEHILGPNKIEAWIQSERSISSVYLPCLNHGDYTESVLF